MQEDFSCNLAKNEKIIMKVVTGLGIHHKFFHLVQEFTLKNGILKTACPIQANVTVFLPCLGLALGLYSKQFFWILGRSFLAFSCLSRIRWHLQRSVAFPSETYPNKVSTRMFLWADHFQSICIVKWTVNTLTQETLFRTLGNFGQKNMCLTIAKRNSALLIGNECLSKPYISDVQSMNLASFQQCFGGGG